jgi:uncharacterized tellurite resistance protein B-like protein
VQSIGAPRAHHVDAARTLLRELPLDLIAATREPRCTHALVLALLLDRDPTRREKQFRAARERGGRARARGQGAVSSSSSRWKRHQRLPLLELAIPALRLLPRTDREQLLRDARALARADGTLSPFEWALLRCLERHVRVADQAPRRPQRPAALVQHGHEASVVLSALARAGAGGDETLATLAFARGQSLLQVPPAQLLPREQGSIEALDAAVDALSAVSPLGKRNLVAACAEAAGADGQLSQDEADLLRALAELLDCPVPLVTSPAGVPLSS